MHRGLFILTALLCMFVISASGFEIRGKVTSIWEENSFTIETRSEQTTLWFNLPQNEGVFVRAEASDAPIKELRLKLSEPLILIGMKEWKITIHWDSVDCSYSCRLLSGEEPVLKRVQGYADTSYLFRFSLVTEEDVAVWNWTYPKEATFIVRQTSPGMRGFEEQDLADNTKVKLIGAGVFNIEVDPVDGGGQFVAERVQ
ncbi:MAG: hypothetical protein ACUVUR_05260 [bacterium]